jgi:two-component system, OmpR family, response regulator
VTLSIFIVEDNQMVRDDLVDAIDECVRCTWLGQSSDAADAIAWVESHRGDWQLLIVDLFLGNGSGLDVVAACRQREGRQRVVVLTNYATAEIRRRALELGADAVFDKSTELEELLGYCSKLGSQ